MVGHASAICMIVVIKQGVMLFFQFSPDRDQRRAAVHARFQDTPADSAVP